MDNKIRIFCQVFGGKSPTMALRISRQMSWPSLLSLMASRMEIAASQIVQVVLAGHQAVINDVDLIEKDDKLLLIIDGSRSREALGLSQETELRVDPLQNE